MSWEQGGAEPAFRPGASTPKSALLPGHQLVLAGPAPRSPIASGLSLIRACTAGGDTNTGRGAQLLKKREARAQDPFPAQVLTPAFHLPTPSALGRPLAWRGTLSQCQPSRLGRTTIAGRAS